MPKNIESRVDDRGRRYVGEGGSSFARQVFLVNPDDRSWTRHRYVLWFGACAPTCLMVWANGLDDALEGAAEWLAAFAPGNLVANWGDEHRELVQEVCESRGIEFPAGFDALEDETKWEICGEAEADLTRTESGFLTSYEWGLNLEDPDRAELLAFLGSL